MIDFDEAQHDLRSMGMEIPQHTRNTIENYLIRGWAPGGFVESMIAKDYDRALYTADTANRQMFWIIAMWVNECMPAQSRGSYNAINHWRDDLGGRRTKFVKDLEQKHIWKTLSEKQYA